MFTRAMSSINRWHAQAQYIVFKLWATLHDGWSTDVAYLCLGLRDLVYARDATSQAQAQVQAKGRFSLLVLALMLAVLQADLHWGTCFALIPTSCNIKRLRLLTTYQYQTPPVALQCSLFLQICHNAAFSGPLLPPHRGLETKDVSETIWFY